jgi:hypothetical protein
VPDDLENASQVRQKRQKHEAGEKQKESSRLRGGHGKWRRIARLRQGIGGRGRRGRGDLPPQQKTGTTGGKPELGPRLDVGGMPFMAMRIRAVACSDHIGVAVRNAGSMSTSAGTNGVDKSFSARSCGETGVIATSEIPFPQPVRARCWPSLRRISPCGKVTCLFV